MTYLDQIKQLLEDDGFQPGLATVEEQGAAGADGADGEAVEVQYLTLPLRSDELGRDHELVMRFFQGDGEELSASILSISLTFPFFIANVESVLEVMRLLHWLNRLLPVGHYGLQEDNMAVDYVYNLVVGDSRKVDAALLRETVAMIAFFTDAHAGVIEQVVDGAVGCDEVLEAIQRSAGDGAGPT